MNDLIMPITTPIDFDYNQELYQDLTPRSKELLVDLFNFYRTAHDLEKIRKETYTKEQLLKILAGRFEEQMKEFLEYYESLSEEGVRTDPIVEFVGEHYEISEEKLKVNNRYELIILLLRNDLIQVIDEIIVRSKIRAKAPTNSYKLGEAVSLEDLEGRLTSFHEFWNQGDETEKALLVEIEYKSNNIAALKLYQEVNEQQQPTFTFRLDGDSEEFPRTPEVTQVSYVQLKTIRLQLEVHDASTKVVFSSPSETWRSTLRPFFDEVFGVDDFYSERSVETSEVAEELEETMIQKVENREDPVEGAREILEEKQGSAISEVDDMDLPQEHKEDLKDSIRSIQISGSEIIDDPSIETQEFRLVATLEQLFQTVDGIEEGFQEMLKQADSESQAFVLSVDGRPVQFTDGKWRPAGRGRLPHRTRKALQIFFED